MKRRELIKNSLIALGSLSFVSRAKSENDFSFTAMGNRDNPHGQLEISGKYEPGEVPFYSPSIGDLWFDTSKDKVYEWNGAQWQLTN